MWVVWVRWREVGFGRFWEGEGGGSRCLIIQISCMPVLGLVG